MIPRTDKRKLTKRIIHPGAPIDPQMTATMTQQDKIAHGKPLEPPKRSGGCGDSRSDDITGIMCVFIAESFLTKTEKSPAMMLHRLSPARQRRQEARVYFCLFSDSYPTLTSHDSQEGSLQFFSKN